MESKEAIFEKGMEVSDYIDIKKGYCTDCNREASFTYFEGNKTLFESIEQIKQHCADNHPNKYHYYNLRQ